MNTSSYFRLRYSRSMRDVVEKPPLAVHADTHTADRQLVNEGRTGELHALIGIEDARLAMPIHRILQGFDTENSVSMLIDKRQARTRRLNQSITATRYTNPLANGM